MTHHAIHHLCEDAGDGTPMMFDLVYDGCNYDFLTQCGSRPKCDECNDNCENPTTQPDCGHEMDCSNKVDILKFINIKDPFLRYIYIDVIRLMAIIVTTQGMR